MGAGRIGNRGLAVEYVLVAIVVGLIALFAIARFGGSVRERYRSAADNAEEAGQVEDRQADAEIESDVDETVAADGGASSTEGTAARGQPEPQDPRAAKSKPDDLMSYATSSTVWMGVTIGIGVLILLVRALKSVKRSSPALAERNVEDERAEQKNAAKARRQRMSLDDKGQTSFEFLMATLLAITIILGILQIGLLFNAHSMVKLAAFNAARAAVVARDEQPTEPVTLEEMRSKAKLAAFLTVFPVIPWIHAAAPRSLSDIPGSLGNLLTLPDNPGGLDPFDPGASLPPVALAAMEFFLNCIDVKFVDPRAQDPAAAEEITIGEAVEFDDRAKSGENVIKVLVTWQYPLIMPFVNRIFIAAMNPFRYAAALTLAGGNPLDLIQPDAFDRIPVWAYGTSIEGLVNNRTLSFASCLAPDQPVPTSRIPVRATYVMRMQWDRRPQN